MNSGALALVALLSMQAPLAAPPAGGPASPPAGSSPILVPFSSPESMARLERSKHKVDFFVLANHYESQSNGGMCGPTTAVIVLNALRVDNASVAKPRDWSSIPEEARARIPKGFDPTFARYTQGTFFDETFTRVKSREAFYGAPAPGGKRSPGLELRELGAILDGHGLQVQVRVVDAKASEAGIKQEIIENLGRSGDYVVANYLRGVLGQKGGGHLSPVAAWDERSDSFLVLDVNANEGKTWAWVPASALVAAMRTPDVRENRGYLLVKEGLPPAPSVPGDRGAK